MSKMSEMVSFLCKRIEEQDKVILRHDQMLSYVNVPQSVVPQSFKKERRVDEENELDEELENELKELDTIIKNKKAVKKKVEQKHEELESDESSTDDSDLKKKD